MNDFDQDMAESMRIAARSWSAFFASMSVFQGNCQRFNFVDAEKERAGLHELLDCYMDNFAAANRRVEVESMAKPK